MSHALISSPQIRDKASCLRRPDAARVVENALWFFHEERYELRAWVVMPNHVHVLFQTGAVAMTDIVESWKSYTANA